MNRSWTGTSLARWHRAMGSAPLGAVLLMSTLVSASCAPRVKVVRDERVVRSELSQPQRRAPVGAPSPQGENLVIAAAYEPTCDVRRIDTVEVHEKIEKRPAWGGVWEVVMEAGVLGTLTAFTVYAAAKDELSPVGAGVAWSVGVGSLAFPLGNQIRAIDDSKTYQEIHPPVLISAGCPAQPYANGQLELVSVDGSRLAPDQPCRYEVQTDGQGTAQVGLSLFPPSCLLGRMEISALGGKPTVLELITTDPGRRAAAENRELYLRVLASRISEAKTPEEIRRLFRGMSIEDLAALPEGVRSYAIAMTALAEADRAIVRLAGDEIGRIVEIQKTAGEKTDSAISALERLLSAALQGSSAIESYYKDFIGDKNEAILWVQHAKFAFMTVTEKLGPERARVELCINLAFTKLGALRNRTLRKRAEYLINGQNLPSIDVLLGVELDYLEKSVTNMETIQADLREAGLIDASGFEILPSIFEILRREQR